MTEEAPGRGLTRLSAHGAAILDVTAALVVLADLDGHVVDVNPAVLAVTGAARPDLVGRDAAGVLCPPRDAADFLHVQRAVGRTGVPLVHEHDLPTTGPDRTSVAWTTSRLPGEPRRLVLVGVDVTAARVASEDLLTRTITDELTGLPNRAHLLEVLGRMTGSGASVLFCDLNGFKGVNDSFGHAAGDAVLVEVARRLTLAVRHEDMVARLGGDEFVIVAPPSPTASPEGLARRVLSAMRQPMLLVGGVVVVVGVSIGTAELRPGQEPAEVLRQADAHMYTAKSLRTSGGAKR
jgi:diguanylate cyclase (GGDEF)-like protein/PAS domain S-box-containing protein